LESSLNRTELHEDNDPSLIVGLDTLGRSSNTTIYLYAGRKIGKRDQLYALFDMTDYEDRDLHIKSNQLTKFGLGWQHDFSPFLKSQIQIEHFTGDQNLEVVAPQKQQLNLRISYCLF
jgi:hypothetical protein